MSNHGNILQKINSLSETDIKQVEDFIAFIASKKSATQGNVNVSQQKPLFGAAKGFFIVKGNFNEPLEEFNEYM